MISPENIIKINDVEYIKKEDFDKLKEKKEKENKPKSVQRFTATEEQKILSLLNRIFNGPGKDTIGEEHAVESGAVVIDPANVCLVSGKSEKAKRLLARYISVDNEEKKMPHWEFITKEGDKCSSDYSMEYLAKIFEFFSKISSEKVKISMLHNHPIQIEDSDFAFVLAPRIETEDE